VTDSPATPPSRFSPEELRRFWDDYYNAPENQPGPTLDLGNPYHVIELEALQRVVWGDRERRGGDAVTGVVGTTSTQD
jgi:hypothetical protein